MNIYSDLKFIWIELTNKCNLECTHCYTESSNRISLYSGMMKADWEKTIKDAYDSGCEAIQFIGGEPTLNPLLPSLIEYSNFIGYRFIEVYTNALGVSSTLLLTMKKNKVNVATSFYSSNSSYHDKITTKEGSWKNTTNTIKKLLKEGIHVRASIIDFNNPLQEIENTQKYLRNLGIKDVGLDRVRDVGRANHTMSIEQDTCGHCWNAKLCITPTGDVYPCVFSRKSLIGNVKNQSIKSLLNTNVLAEFRKEGHIKQELNIQEKQNFNNSESNGCFPMCLPSCMPNGYCAPNFT